MSSLDITDYSTVDIAYLCCIARVAGPVVSELLMELASRLGTFFATPTQRLSSGRRLSLIETPLFRAYMV